VAIGGSLDLQSDAVGEVAFGAPEQAVEPVGDFRRILSGGQRHDADVESLGGRELHAAERRRLAGRVRVEAQVKPPRQTPQLLELGLRERGSHRRDNGLDSRLPKGEHVRIALDDARALLFRDRSARPVEPVDDLSLLEELPFG
jgi:hypothetical protein